MSAEGRLRTFFIILFFQAEEGIRDLVRSRGLGDVYKRQELRGALREKRFSLYSPSKSTSIHSRSSGGVAQLVRVPDCRSCLLYTSDAADERSSVDLGGRRIIKKKNKVVI